MSNAAVGVISILIFLFIYWKRLREDYLGGQIFTSALYILIGLALGYLISFKFAPTLWFWTSLLGIFAGFLTAVLRFHLRFFETLEAASVGFLPWVLFLFLADSVKNSSYVSLIGAFFVLLLLFLFYYLDGHYRDFVWYKSGKIGFSGLATLSVFFLVRALVALLSPFVLSFGGKAEVYLSGGAAFILFLVIFNLARQEI